MICWFSRAKVKRFTHTAGAAFATWMYCCYHCCYDVLQKVVFVRLGWQYMSRASRAVQYHANCAQPALRIWTVYTPTRVIIAPRILLWKGADAPVTLFHQYYLY
jgi:hypothetical protein